MKKGKFSITKEQLEKHDEVVEIFYLMKVVIIRAEYNYCAERIDYIGISPLFKDLEVGCEPQHYEIFVNAVNGKVVGVEV